MLIKKKKNQGDGKNFIKMVVLRCSFCRIAGIFVIAKLDEIKSWQSILSLDFIKSMEFFKDSAESVESLELFCNFCVFI